MPRRPLFFPVVIAMIFLTVIGMSAGLVLGARHKRADQALPPRNNPTPVATTAAPTRSAGPPCRPETQQAARRFNAQGVLTSVLVLRTRSSTVWICEDDAGRLYYHANRGGADAPWVEGRTALFMADVRPEGDGYEVTAADGTRFSVDSRRLFIQHADGREETQTAVR